MLQKEKRYHREGKILQTLHSLQYATRKQLQTIEQLGGDRNAHRILLEMERDKLIQSIRKEEKIYSLANAGRDRIGVEGANMTGRMVEHSLMRNDLYIRLNMPSDWNIEVPIPLPDGEMICDAMYTKNGQYHFVEIDHKLSMRNNKEKLDRYKELSKGVYRQYNHHPTIIYYTREERKDKLEQAIRERGLKGIVYV